MYVWYRRWPTTERGKTSAFSHRNRAMETADTQTRKSISSKCSVSSSTTKPDAYMYVCSIVMSSWLKVGRMECKYVVCMYICSDYALKEGFGNENINSMIDICICIFIGSNTWGLCFEVSSKFFRRLFLIVAHLIAETAAWAIQSELDIYTVKLYIISFVRALYQHVEAYSYEYIL